MQDASQQCQHNTQPICVELRTCDFVTTSEEKRSRHCNQHDWRSAPGNRTNWAVVMLQSFCAVSQFLKWFIIASIDSHDTEDEDGSKNPTVN
jgi:hypothetical protein